MYQLRATLFDKVESFTIPYKGKQKLLNNMAKFYFEPICRQDENFKGAETKTWIWKHNLIFVIISFNSKQQVISFCDPNLPDLVSSLIDALKKLTIQSQAQYYINCSPFRITIKSKFARSLQVINHIAVSLSVLEQMTINLKKSQHSF